MKEYFRQSMAWLHTWVGLVLGWVLYFVFLTGTAGYFDTEIDRWMQPELPPVVAGTDRADLAEHGRQRLETLAPTAERWVINVALDRNDPYPRIFWQGAKGPDSAKSGNLQFDPDTGALLDARETGGGQLLYRMHWKLHYLPEIVGEWIVAIATMFMLVALVTGIIVHKKMFADFFTFRPAKGPRSWLDAHNVTSVLSLPFQLMITYSGLVFQMLTLLPFIVAANYGSGRAAEKAFQKDVFDPPALAARAGVAAPLVPLAPMIAAAESRWGAGNVRALDIRHPGDANARVIVGGDIATGPLRAAERLVFDGVSGTLLARQPAAESTPKLVRDVFLGLHEGLFAGPAARALYALSGLLGAAMVATGLVLWTVKRRQRSETAGGPAHPGLLCVERLNVAAIVGLPVAIAAYFWANRLLPAEMAQREAWEAHVLFVTWAVLGLHAALRPAVRAWREQLVLAAAAFALLPVVNAVTTGRHLAQSVPAGDWLFAGFDLAMLGFGLLFALVARYLIRRGSAASLRPAMGKIVAEARS